MIIKDVIGGKLRLTKDRLEEVTGGMYTSVKYYALFKNIKKAVRAVRIVSSDPTVGKGFNVHFSAKQFEIGCRTFSPATFAKILKAAGVKVARKKKK